MNLLSISLLSMLAVSGEKLGPGDHERLLQIGDLHRSYVVHVPPHYDPKHPLPVVLALHGAGTNGRMTAVLTGLNKKADEASFAVVYPNGTGAGGIMLTWNSGGLRRTGEGARPTTWATSARCSTTCKRASRSMPSGSMPPACPTARMMCYRLASEMSDRIAAIAPVAGHDRHRQLPSEAARARDPFPRHGRQAGPVRGLGERCHEVPRFQVGAGNDANSRRAATPAPAIRRRPNCPTRPTTARR